MMMGRRLVNLAMADYNNCMFSLHRIDLSKLLFYPSAAEAEAAGSRGRGRVGKGRSSKPPKIGQLRLPPPTMGFEPYPGDREQFLVPEECSSGMFVLLHGSGGPSSEPSRVLFTSSEGLAAMYDFDSRSVLTVPELGLGVVPRNPVVTTGAGAWEEDLYVMCPDWEFKLLDMTNLVWKPLPPLPVRAANISSFTVVDGGRIICVSSAGSDDYGTFCFDTVSQEWWRAGDWKLPFHGRAEYVPELDTWLGFSGGHPHHLCAADLSAVAMAPRQAPALKHVWEDFNPPPTEESSFVLNKDYPGIFITTTVCWLMTKLFLVNLGCGRFCVAKVIHGEKSVSPSWSFDTDREPKGTLAVLTGIEVIRGGGDGGEGELRMVKHKSRQLVQPGLELDCVL